MRKDFLRGCQFLAALVRSEPPDRRWPAISKIYHRAPHLIGASLQFGHVLYLCEQSGWVVLSGGLLTDDAELSPGPNCPPDAPSLVERAVEKELKLVWRKQYLRQNTRDMRFW